MQFLGCHLAQYERTEVSFPNAYLGDTCPPLASNFLFGGSKHYTTVLSPSCRLLSKHASAQHAKESFAHHAACSSANSR